MTGPGQPGSQGPATPNWQAVEIRKLKQEIAQLRGQQSAQKAASAGTVTNVSVAGSVLTVTFGNGTTRTYQLP